MTGLSFGKRQGSLDLLDFDSGIVETFGARFDLDKKQYFMPINMFDEVKNQKVTKAQVVYKKPEPTDNNFILPMIVVTRDNVVPATNRLTSPTVQYRLPAPGATRVSAGGTLGWNLYETKEKEQPYDISYTIECWARYRQEAQTLLLMVMASFPQQTAAVTVKDSLGVSRKYMVTQQGTADLTQISSMVDRIPGFSFSIKCEAELTLDRVAFIVPAFTGELSRDPNGGPDPGAGGLYGDGKPIIRVGVNNT